MKRRIWKLIAACVALVLIAGCAASDGGIVGSGNRGDCDSSTKKEECK